MRKQNAASSERSAGEVLDYQRIAESIVREIGDISRQDAPLTYAASRNAGSIVRKVGDISHRMTAHPHSIAQYVYAKL
jgi:hypothetical protein